MEGVDRRSYMEALFGRTFSDEDFIVTEEETMAMEEENKRMEDLRMQLIALKARTGTMSKENYDRFARKLVMEFLKDD